MLVSVRLGTTLTGQWVPPERLRRESFEGALREMGRRELGPTGEDWSGITGGYGNARWKGNRHSGSVDSPVATGRAR